METNYYELLKILTEYELKFLKTKDFETLFLLVLEIKSFIFGNDFLRVEYKKRLDEFVTQKNTSQFQEEKILPCYKQVKHYVQRNAVQNMRNVEYQESVTQFPENKAVLTVDSEIKYTVYDRPKDFIYPSVLLSNLKLNDNELLQLLPLKVSCITGLYCEYFNVPLAQLPLGLEYYIFTGQPSLDFANIEKGFILICIATAVLYVLQDLCSLLEFEINIKYYKVQTGEINSSGIKINELYQLLTLTEKKVFNLYNSGNSITNIARTQQMSEITVRTHLNNIADKAKLEPANKTELDKYLRGQFLNYYNTMT